jgi:hypothetical protein
MAGRNAPRPARAVWPSRPAQAQRILAGNEPVWSIPSGNVNPTRCGARVMVSIRVIGEDDAVALASGKAEFELDAMPVTSCSAGTGELLGRSLILVAPPRPDVGSTRSSIVKNGRPRRRRDLMAMAAASPCAHREQLARVSIAHF